MLYCSSVKNAARPHFQLQFELMNRKKSKHMQQIILDIQANDQEKKIWMSLWFKIGSMRLGVGGIFWIKNEVKNKHYGIGLIYPIGTIAWLTGNS